MDKKFKNVFATPDFSAVLYFLTTGRKYKYSANALVWNQTTKAKELKKENNIASIILMTLDCMKVYYPILNSWNKYN